MPYCHPGGVHLNIRGVRERWVVTRRAAVKVLSMSPQDLKIGCEYYRVTYADPDRTIPGVQPMFYVATNITDDDYPATLVYYFQDTISHSWRGPVTDPAHGSKHPEIEVAVFPHTESEVKREVFTLDGVIAALTEARRRIEGKR